MRGLVAAALAFALIAGAVPPLRAAADGNSDQRTALALINTPCLVAQAGAEASASPSASPSGSPAAAEDEEATPAPTPTPSPSPVPPIAPPIIPGGPGVLRLPPLPTSTPQQTAPPLPTPTPSPSGSPGPVYLIPATPAPSPSPTPVLTAGPIRGISQPTPTPAATASPAPGETLGPNDYAILGDTLTGNRNPGQPFDLDGNVNVIYQDGILVGDHAHYDGTRYIDITGHTFLQNHAGDTTFTADSIRFDTKTQQALLINGKGVTTEGVDQGRLHFNAQEMQTYRNGFTHGTHASLTTCENPHGGYHIEAKSLDITPGDKAIARSAVLFLGPLAILYLPLMVIPLRHETGIGNRRSNFVPLIGYSAAEGFYVKARIGFGTTDYYYGYYRVELYTKIGYGLGYVATIRSRNGKRAIDVDVFRLHNRTDGSDTWNVNLNDQETFSPALKFTERFSYQADYGPLITLPPSLSLALGLTKSTPKDTENYSFARQTSGSQIATNNYGVSDNYTFSPRLSNALTASYTTNESSYSGFSQTYTQLHLNTDTHLSENSLDYDLIFDRYDSTTPSGVNKLPELDIRPHGSLFGHFFGIPNTATFAIGDYSDPVASLAAGRAQGQFNFGPLLYHLPVGDFNFTVNVLQDYYTTGDAKAEIEQQANLTTPLGNHFSNTLSYSNQHINGLGNEPFAFDTIGGAYKNLEEVFKVFNGSVYALSLQTGTAFNMMAQPIQYQLLTRPSPRSALVLGGNWNPGPGNGFDRTNVQVITPLGPDTDIQFSTFVDWKNKGRLESKNIYLRRTIGNCYQVNIAYNQDLKTVAVTVNLLAFPTEAVNFGLGQQTSIIPQSFATSQFFSGQ